MQTKPILFYSVSKHAKNFGILKKRLMTPPMTTNVGWSLIPITVPKTMGHGIIRSKFMS